MITYLLDWSWLFPLPTLLLSAFGLPKRAGILSWLAPFSIFVVALAALFVEGFATQAFHEPGWIPFLPDDELRLTVDPLAGVMLLVVGGVATCVYVYALAYMHEDDRQHRFFAFLDFFVAAMCLLVVAGNLSVLLIGWTGVGIASFLLISFWWQKGEPLQAGFLALGANAIGDAALLVACVLVPKGAGELTGLDAPEVLAGVPGGASTLAWLLVIAAMAKSAQGPLWWWLPSAMAGPTPVSALIHAATMVAAGIYLLVRVSPLLELTEAVSYNVAIIGISTAIGGGIASLWQPNFKRGLAYSTVSQLGWMFAAIGIGAPFAALFHLITHAAFKAMLFLAAGTVIAATHHEEQIVNVGGLRKKLPFAHAYFVIGTLALIGAPLITAGSFSKDAILEAGIHHESWSFFGWIMLGSVVLTGAYAGRLLFGVFYGKEGSSSHHAHAPGAGFDLPLIPLAIGAIGLGWLEAGTHFLSSLLAPVVAAPKHEVHALPTGWLGWAAFGAGLVGVAIGYAISRTPSKSLPMPPLGIVDSLLGEVRALPEGVAAVHAGRIGRYALIGLVGTALFVLLAQRPSSTGASSTSTSSTSGAKPAAGAAGKAAGASDHPPHPGHDEERERPRRTTRTIGPQQGKPTTPVARPAKPGDDEAKRRAASERIQKMLGNEDGAALKKALEERRKAAEGKKKREGAQGSQP